MVFVSGDPLVAILIPEAFEETIAEVAIFFAGASQVGVVFGFLRLFAFLVAVAVFLSIGFVTLAFVFLFSTFTSFTRFPISFVLTFTLLRLHLLRVDKVVEGVLNVLCRGFEIAVEVRGGCKDDVFKRELVILQTLLGEEGRLFLDREGLFDEVVDGVGGFINSSFVDLLLGGDLSFETF